LEKKELWFNGDEPYIGTHLLSTKERDS
jgi:hypothetical protein